MEKDGDARKEGNLWRRERERLVWLGVKIGETFRRQKRKVGKGER